MKNVFKQTNKYDVINNMTDEKEKVRAFEKLERRKMLRIFMIFAAIVLTTRVNVNINE